VVNHENNGISILLATYNERDNMKPLVEAIRETVKPFNIPFEIDRCHYRFSLLIEIY